MTATRAGDAHVCLRDKLFASFREVYSGGGRNAASKYCRKKKKKEKVAPESIFQC